MWWKLVKKAKELWSWINFIGHIVGWLGLGAIFSGIGFTGAGIVGAVMKGLPWPLVLMDSYCTLVGTAYLAALPILVRALKNIDNSTSSGAIRTKQEPVRPYYEAWKHVEKFTVRQAAYLWVEMEPRAEERSTEVDAWIGAFCEAVRTGKIEFIYRGSEFNEGSYIDRAEKSSRKERPSQYAEVSRSELIRFARSNDCHPKFLENG
jgi:hypothetical protein